MRTYEIVTGDQVTLTIRARVRPAAVPIFNEHTPDFNHITRRAATMAIGVWPVICGLPVFGQCNKNRKTILDDCFDERSDEPAAVCLKTKALSALDRALSKPVATVVAGKALTIDQAAEKAGRAAPGAAKVSDEKNVLLDDMLAYRMDRLVSARTIVLLDGPEGQEGEQQAQTRKIN